MGTIRTLPLSFSKILQTQILLILLLGTCYLIIKINDKTQQIFLSSIKRKFLYFAIIAPGIIVHEFSHLLAAKIMGIPTGKIILFRPQKTNEREYKLGSVEIAQTNDRISSSLISLAPLFIGSILFIIIIYYLILNGDKNLLNPKNWITIFTTKEGITKIIKGLKTYKPYLGLYLGYCVIATNTPSETDLRIAKSGLLILIIIIEGFCFFFPQFLIPFLLICTITMTLTLIPNLILFLWARKRLKKSFLKNSYHQIKTERFPPQ